MGPGFVLGEQGLALEFNCNFLTYTQRSSLYLTIVLAVTKPARRPVKGERRAFR
jgi:hypothetical protein